MTVARAERANPDEISSNGETQERRLPVIVILKERDWTRPELQAYVDFLNFWGWNKRGEWVDNLVHFSNPPQTAKELLERTEDPATHLLIALDERGEVVGGLFIGDASPNEHDHWLKALVVDPNRQREGLGSEIMRQALDWAATTKAHDNRWRHKIDLATHRDVPNWRRMKRLAERMAFDVVYKRLRDEVDVTRHKPPHGEEVRLRVDVIRFELMLNTWRTIRGLPIPPDELEPKIGSD